MATREINKNIFYASVINHNGYPAIQIRKIVSDKKIITKIAKKILEEGVYEVNGVLIFRNPIIAIKNLKNLGLIESDVDDFFDFKFF